MLDIGWWELLVVGMVALVVVGPKELPTLLRTIGHYVGMAKRQADETAASAKDSGQTVTDVVFLARARQAGGGNTSR